jgi:hypothetical protein
LRSASRPGRQQAKPAAKQHPMPKGHPVVLPPKSDMPSLLCGDLIVDEAKRMFCVFERPH